MAIQKSLDPQAWNVLKSHVHSEYVSDHTGGMQPAQAGLLSHWPHAATETCQCLLAECPGTAALLLLCHSRL